MATNRERTLLAPSSYDDDASSLRTLSDQDSDSEDDEVLHGAQNSLEIAEHDRGVLEEEEEREKLLASGSSIEGLRRIFSGGLSNGSRVKIGKSEKIKRRRERRERRAHKGRLMAGHGEEGEMMMEMEQGGFRSEDDTGSSDESSELDRRKYRDVFGKKSKPSRCCILIFVFSFVTVLFLIIFLGAYQISRASRPKNNPGLLSNGTSIFAPTTILISLDGFRADFLNRGLTPTLNKFIKDGISPKYMLPSFPSVTFPNHFTLVTGLYPESHGIVGNTFWDPELEAEFFYTDPARSMDPKWWNGEPIWVTAERQGISSAIHMWPGSEAHVGGIEPTFLDRYNSTEVLSRKVDRILELIDLPSREDESATDGDKRPQFIAAYVPNVDADGHLYGPNSTEIRDTIASADNMLGSLFANLANRNLTDVVNIVVVSDHGMATTATERLIQLDDIIDVDKLAHIDGWPLYGLRPKNPDDLRGLYDQLVAESEADRHYEVYLKDTMPERYHFTNNDRIAPLWIVPETGWAIVTKKDFDVAKAKANNEIYHPRGLHGYDHENPLMRAIFVAHGPAFPHKPHSKVEVFQNTEVYNILCDSLAITPKPNNGTLRLPLKPTGLHSDDPPNNATEAPDLDLPPTNMTGPPTPEHSAAPVGVDTPDLMPERPVVGDDGKKKVSEDDKTKIQAWADFFEGKIEGIKGWFEDLFHGDGAKGETSGSD